MLRDLAARIRFLPIVSPVIAAKHERVTRVAMKAFVGRDRGSIGRNGISFDHRVRSPFGKHEEKEDGRNNTSPILLLCKY